MTLASKLAIAAPGRYRQGRKGLQARVDEVHGSGVSGRQGANAIKIACKRVFQCREVTPASDHKDKRAALTPKGFGSEPRIETIRELGAV
jgi:hypothetical protein